MTGSGLGRLLVGRATSPGGDDTLRLMSSSASRLLANLGAGDDLVWLIGNDFAEAQLGWGGMVATRSRSADTGARSRSSASKSKISPEAGDRRRSE